MIPIEGMRQRLTAADAAGLQLCIHAIGDQAISVVLDLFTDVARANGARDRRFRIEHAQHVAPKDFDRFASQGVVAAVQPYHAIDDGRWAERRIGPARIQTTYAFRTFLDKGVRVAFGSDWPVAPLSPILGIYAAVTRADARREAPGRLGSGPEDHGRGGRPGLHGRFGVRGIHRRGEGDARAGFTGRRRHAVRRHLRDRPGADP